MNTRAKYALFSCCLIVMFLPAMYAKADALDQLISSKDRFVQRQVLYTIAKNKSQYSKKVAQRIEDCYKKKGPRQELWILLDVAALIKSKEPIPILEKIWLDQTSFEDDCIYCCPRTLVMTVFGLHKLWIPQNISPTQRKTAAQIEDTLLTLERFEKHPPSTTLKARPDIEGNSEIEALIRKYLLFKEETLLEIATNPKAEYFERYVASSELNRRTVDDHLLVDYYWWALNACEDASGECLCSAHESIFAAEFFNSKRSH